MMPLKVAYDYNTLGAWDSNGIPQYLDGRIAVPTNIVDRTREIIEDSIRVFGNAFLDRNAVDIYLKEDGEVFATLLYEDAGWKNTIGFYTYTTDNIPESSDEIGDLTIIFPNLDSPDIVDNGMRVSLGTYPKHTVFGFFLVAQGWNGNIDNGLYTLFSNGEFNREFTEGGLYNQMTIIFPNDLTTDNTTDFLLCMEDNVDTSEGDYDYNDAVFQLASSPESALDQFKEGLLTPPMANDTLFTIYENDTVIFSIDDLLQNHEFIDVSSLDFITNTDHFSTLDFDGTNLTVGLTDASFDTLALQYSVCNEEFNTLCDTGIIYIALAGMNQPPVALKDVVIKYDSSLSTTGILYDVLANDPDNNLNTDHLTVLNSINQIFFAVVDNGNLKIIPKTNAVGSDTVYFEVCDLGMPVYCDTGFVIIEFPEPEVIPITPVVPIAVNDTINLVNNEEVSINVLANDSHPDDDLNIASLKLIETPSIEGLEIEIVNGTLVHTPPQDYTGTYTITYEICDNSMPADCDQAEVIITIPEPIDPVVIIDNNLPPVAKDDFAVTDTDNSLQLFILNNDHDVDGNLNPNSVTLVTPPSNGTVLFDFEVSDGDTTVIAYYIPDNGYEGMDEFTYEVYDDGNPGKKDEAKVVVLVGDEGFTNNSFLFQWIDSTIIAEGSYYNLELEDRVNNVSEINFISRNINLLSQPDLEDAEAKPLSPLNILYSAPGSIPSDNERDYIYYNVCNNDAECVNGLLIVDIFKPQENTIIPDNVEEENINISVFTGFSPNNDLINDYFIVENIENYSDNQLKIFNRWGQEIYREKGYANQWNGVNNSGDPLPDGTYFYLLQIDQNNKTNTYNGFIVLKR
ncbi:Ig-like domain-containing protein [Flammeovirga aprica]|nr:Ig-like domain-containing protein [Flammeovirga aprica]